MATIRDTSTENKIDIVTTIENNVTVTQPSIQTVEVLTGPQGAVGPQGPAGPIPDTGSFVLTSSFNSYTGSSDSQFAGTASFAVTASYAANVPLTASYALQALSASYALTASYLDNYVEPFPYTGSALITGSLTITGSIAVSSSLGGLSEIGVADSSGLTSINFSSRRLKDTNGVNVVDWQTNLIKDRTNINSLHWSNRLFYDASGSKSIDWAGRTLLQSDGSTITIDWENGIFTGSLHGTSSYADFATSASYAISASHEIIKEVSSSHADFAESASYAVTASYLDNYVEPFPYTGSAQITGSLGVSGSLSVNGTVLGPAVTNFTQSLFVTPSGNDATAVVGDMHNPFQTILAATASANPGDTIIVHPGVYFPTAQILKDYVNYYFYPGAIVSGSFQLMSGTYEKVNIRGAGKFETVYNGAPVGFTANGYFECDTVEFAGLQSSGYAGSPSFTQNSAADPNGILELKGNYVYGLKNGARNGNNFNAAINFRAGNIITNVNAFVSSSSQMQGIQITSDSADLRFYGNVYANNGNALQTNSRVGHCTLRGKFETGNQASYRAVWIYPGYVGRFIIDAEILGAIYIDTGEVADSGVIIRGFQAVGSSPDGAAVTINGGYNVLSHTIRASEIIFNQTGPAITHFDGSAFVSSNLTGKLFDIDSGTFIWNGLNAGAAIRALSNIVSGGELIINGPLEHYGSSYPNNTYCFALQGGTLEINNKVIYHQNTTGSGIVNMTGGYLKMNAAQLIHFDETGSYAAAINLNNSNHSGSILNNSFTNLTPFINTGTFVNEVVGGGTLFYSDKIY